MLWQPAMRRHRAWRRASAARRGSLCRGRDIEVGGAKRRASTMALTIAGRSADRAGFADPFRAKRDMASDPQRERRWRERPDGYTGRSTRGRSARPGGQTPRRLPCCHCTTSKAIRAANVGSTSWTPPIAAKLIANRVVPRNVPVQPSTMPPVAELTEREREVLKLVSTCATNREIADALYIGEATVKATSLISWVDLVCATAHRRPCMLATTIWDQPVSLNGAQSTEAATSPHASERRKRNTANPQSIDRTATKSKAKSQGAGWAQPTTNAATAPIASTMLSGR
jgi:Bacterial regulatory proteins, luxR family